jgi:hypothetical protein
MNPRLTLALPLALAFACVKAPDIVIVDRATALEEQAGGSFADLEADLSDAAIAPVPVPLTPAQLEALGLKPLTLVNSTELTDADRVDGLLRQHCLGEGADGLLVDTHGDCHGAEDRARAIELLERVNQARVQLWHWMHEERPAVPEVELRKSWRRAHLTGVVCGGWLQNANGGWEIKKC